MLMIMQKGVRWYKVGSEIIGFESRRYSVGRRRG
jgi:hypothetical protein